MTVRPDTRYPGPTFWTRARWLLRAGPSDYMLAMSVASASLPVIGKHLEPLGGVAAMGIWGYRHMPSFSARPRSPRLSPGNAEVRRRGRDMTRARSRTPRYAVSCPRKDLAIDWPAPERTPPLWRTFEHRRHVHRTSVRYGDHPSQLLDVWRRDDLPQEPAPVLHVRAGRRVGARRPAAAGLRPVVAPGRARLGVPVHRLPRCAAERWPQHITRRQDGHRVGARQRRQVRRRPRFRCDSGHVRPADTCPRWPA